MKCNIKRNTTDNALREDNITVIHHGLELLEEDIKQFLEQKNFKEVSEENAKMNLKYIDSVRKQLLSFRQSFSLNELKVIYIGLNFLRDELEKPVENQAEFLCSMDNTQKEKERKSVSETRQKIMAAFSRLGVDIHSTLRGF